AVERPPEASRCPPRTTIAAYDMRSDSDRRVVVHAKTATRQRTAAEA
ncbi:hypothetical protein ABH935_008091, partial [Catenulispora sp. GAS73]